MHLRDFHLCNWVLHQGYKIPCRIKCSSFKLCWVTGIILVYTASVQTCYWTARGSPRHTQIRGFVRNLNFCRFLYLEFKTIKSVLSKFNKTETSASSCLPPCRKSTLGYMNRVESSFAQKYPHLSWEWWWVWVFGQRQVDPTTGNKNESRHKRKISWKQFKFRNGPLANPLWGRASDWGDGTVLISGWNQTVISIQALHSPTANWLDLFLFIFSFITASLSWCKQPL